MEDLCLAVDVCEEREGKRERETEIWLNRLIYSTIDITFLQLVELLILNNVGAAFLRRPAFSFCVSFLCAICVVYI